MPKEYLFEATTLPMAYHKSLLALRSAPITPCPDWNTNQKEISCTMVIPNPFTENMISKLSYADPASLEQYVQEMLDGILDFEVAQGKWEYTYHQRYAYQYQFIIDELKRNPDSRRAAIAIRNDSDIGSDDPACLQHLQFFIRNGRLDLVVLFRSNDACKAAFMNAFALIMLQKRVADELGVKVGQYTHRANSYHCYERDFEMLDGYCSRIEKSIAEDGYYCNDERVTYSYEDDWKEQMEDARPEIAEKVASLKKEAGIDPDTTFEPGEWIDQNILGMFTVSCCSKCGNVVPTKYKLSICPSCASPMKK